MKLKKKNSSDLEKLRKQLTEADFEIISLLKKRFLITQKIGAYKLIHKLPVHQKDFWKTASEKRKKFASASGVDKKMTKKIFSIIHDFSKSEQKQKSKTK
jgi:shikimate dehydrogenase